LTYGKLAVGASGDGISGDVVELLNRLGVSGSKLVRCTAHAEYSASIY